jgi:ABC-type oligopeptide transport system substrate-binding subunit
MKNQKPRIVLASAALLALALMPSMASTQELKDIKPSQNLVLRGIGSFFLSGDQHVVNAPEAFNSVSGNAMINQMYVQFMKPLTLKRNGRLSSCTGAA